MLNQWLLEHGWPGGMAQVHLEFCSNNLLEIQDQMAPLEGFIIPLYQDLLMEQRKNLTFLKVLNVNYFLRENVCVIM